MSCGARTLDGLAVWLNFFDLKTRHYALMRYATKQFDLNQLFLWKFFCGSIILTFSVVVPCMWLPWGGYSLDGLEKPPPMLHLQVFSGLLSAMSMFVATFNLFRALDRSRFVVRRRIRALSWEMLDWVLYEVSVTATVAAFVFFWLIQLPSAETRIHLLRIEGVLVQFVITSVDFYLTTPHFRKNHVFLALLCPSFWLVLQFVWIVSGHQPTSEVIDYHRWHAPLVALFLFVLFAGTFLTLQHVAGRLRAAQAPSTAFPQDELAKSKLVMSQADDELHITPNQRTGSAPNSTLASYELMNKSQRAQGALLPDPRESTDSDTGVYRIGSSDGTGVVRASDASSSDNSHRVIAMGSWVGEVPPHVHPDESARENSCLMSLHHIR